MKGEAMTPMERAAYHEAGHAVIGWRLADQLIGDGIWINESGCGMEHHEPTLLRMDAEAAEHSSFERECYVAKVEACVMQLLAGSLAERRASKERTRGFRFGVEDLGEAKKVIKTLPNCWIREDPDYNLYLWLLRRDAQRMIRQSETWAAICAVAEKLIQCRKLSCDEFKATMEQFDLSFTVPGYLPKRWNRLSALKASEEKWKLRRGI